MKADSTAEVAELVIRFRAYDKGPFPESDVQRAIELREEMIPVLIQQLKFTANEFGRTCASDDWFFDNLALFMLGYFQEKSAFEHVLAICHLPAEFTDILLGDSITEELHKILASTFNGDWARLREIITDRNIDEFVRTAAFRAHFVLHQNGVLSREDLIDYMRRLFAELKGDASHVHDALVDMCADIHATELEPEVVLAYQSGDVDGGFATLKSIKGDFAQPRKEVLKKFFSDHFYRYPRDPIYEMSGWLCFHEKDHEVPKPKIGSLPNYFNKIQSPIKYLFGGSKPFIRSEPKPGRNDPCPCGSGKKVKKCACSNTTAVGTLIEFRSSGAALPEPDQYAKCDCGSQKSYKFCCKNKIFTYSFKVKHRRLTDFHCTVTLTGDKTLCTLHQFIQKAFKWDDDHMFSFYMDNDFGSSNQEYSANPYGEGSAEIAIKALRLKEGQIFSYLFDYGDSHEFQVEVLSIEEPDSEKNHTSLFERFGPAPEQYADHY
jgi:hypothetical protein